MPVKVTILLLITSIILSMFGYLYVNNHIATIGQNLQDMEDRLREQKKETIQLKAQIDYFGSYTIIASEAAKMGYINGEGRVLYLKGKK